MSGAATRKRGSSSSLLGASFDGGGGGDAKRQMFHAVRSNDLPALQAVLSSGDDANITLGDTDTSGRTTLHVAAAVADADMVRFLVKQGLGVDVPDRRMNTPLHAAAKSNSAEVVSLLLGYGSDALLKNSEGHTPLSLAQIKVRSAVVKVLRRHVAEISAAPQAPTPPRLVRRSPTSLTVAWMAPGPLGACEPPVTSYDLRFSLRGVFTPWTTRVGLAHCGPVEISELAAGRDYVMQVRARNKNGQGPYSTKSSTMTTGKRAQYEADGSSSSGGAEGGSPRGSFTANGSLGSSTGASAVTTPPRPGDAPFGRSESYQTMESQRDHAELRAKELADQRSLAEQAMLRIDREREGLSDKLGEARTEAKRLRQEGRAKDAKIALIQHRLDAFEAETLEKEKELKKEMETTAAHAQMRSNSATDETTEALRRELDEANAAVVAAERRAQTAEEQCAVRLKQAEASRRARTTAEADAAEARRQRDFAEKSAEAERAGRTEAELHAAELGALVGKLQRQRDAAEAIVAQLEAMTAPPLPARDADAATTTAAAIAGKGSWVFGGGAEASASSHILAAETIAQLQDALKDSNRRVFRLAGVEEQMMALQATHDATLQTLKEAEDSQQLAADDLANLREQREMLRSQRDAAENDAEIAKQARVQKEAALQELKSSYENLLALHEARDGDGREGSGGGVGGGKSAAGDEQKTHEATARAAEAAEAKWKDIVETSADEVFLLMSSMRAHIQKIENVESAMAGARGVGQKVGAPIASLSIEDMVEEDDYESDRG